MEEFMIQEARRGAREGGIPIGAALVDATGKLISIGRNRRIQDNSAIMHAEINCLQNASEFTHNFRGMTLYTTLMPCNMCAGAAVQFQIARVVVGESRNFPKGNGLELLIQHGIEVEDLDLEEPRELLAEFIRDNPEIWKADIGAYVPINLTENQ